MIFLSKPNGLSNKLKPSCIYPPLRVTIQPNFYRRCGRSGIKLPLISLGLWHNFGAKDSYENARAIALPRV